MNNGFVRILGTALLAAVAVFCVLDVAALAQDTTRPPPKDRSQPRDKQDRNAPPPDSKSDKDKGEKSAAAKPRIRAPGSTIPDNPLMRARLLKDLYALLATAEDQDSGNTIAEAIDRVWLSAAGDTVRLLIERAGKAANEERPDLALRLLGTVTRIAPDLPEAFNRRAFVYYSLNEFGFAIADLRRALALDPNNYKALEGLGQILRETEQKKAALEVYRKLYAVHPFASGAKNAVDELERTVGGQKS